jgi:DNA-binding GntR family transcriptional regulator
MVTEPAFPLYRVVSERIVENIVNGTYAVGRLMPTEYEMSQQFGVSRHTVREAVRHVQALGLVSRRQGQGTLVRSAQLRKNMAISLRTFSDIEQHGYYTHLVGLDMEVIEADAVLAADLQVQPGERFLRLRCFRTPTDETMPIPTAWNETFIIADYADIAGQIGTNQGPVYLLIERLFNETICEIEQETSAVLLNAEVASKLKVKPRSAGLRLKRVYRGKRERMVMTAFNTYAGERFSVSMRMRPE